MRGEIAGGGAATLEEELAATPFRELRASFDPKAGLLRCWFAFRGRPCFTHALIDDIKIIQSLARRFHHAGRAGEGVRYICWGSDEPGIWHAGGDLDLFARLIRSRDRDGLEKYAFAVLWAAYQNYLAFDLPLITVALVQGQALGGGFEGALSCNILIAERQARFGLPEALFNLFPGMGAYSYLARKIAPSLAERMIMSGRIYSAEELYELGVVDVLCEDGEGESALYDLVGRTEQKQAMQRAVIDARRRINPIPVAELEEITRSWVELAFKLGERDLSIMTRLVAAQDRRRNRQASAAVS
jgi:DSF synthase